MKKPNFTSVAPNEVKISYKGFNFLLKENSRGVYGLGRAIQLYQLNGLEKVHIKEVCWTKSDNHSCSGMRDSLIPRQFSNMEGAKVAAIAYIDKMI